VEFVGANIRLFHVN